MKDLFYPWRNNPAIWYTEFNGDISSWNTGQVTTMRAMFNNAQVFNQNIGDWNTAQVTDMTETFYHAYRFNQDISGWDTSQVTRMLRTFNMAKDFNQAIGRLGGWDTSQVGDMTYMFSGATAFNQDISSWTGAAATTQQPNMFSGASAFEAKFKCTDAVTGPANSCVGPSPIPDTSWHTFVKDCLDESAATGECIDWAQLQDVWYGTMPNWDTSLVTDMSGHHKGFSQKSTFIGDISKWDTGQVTTMFYMFDSASCAQPRHWGLEHSASEKYVWNVLSSFCVQPRHWALEHSTSDYYAMDVWLRFCVQRRYFEVEHRESDFYVFYASAFNQDIGSWNTFSVTTMESMFQLASAFNQDISLWTGSAAISAQTNMFLDASAFQEKYTCGTSGPASSCNVIESTWIAPSPPRLLLPLLRRLL